MKCLAWLACFELEKSSDMHITQKKLQTIIREETNRFISEYTDPTEDPELFTGGEYDEQAVHAVLDNALISPVKRFKADIATLWRFLERTEEDGTLNGFLIDVFTVTGLGTLMGVIATINSPAALPFGPVAMWPTALLFALIGATAGGVAAISALKQAIKDQNKHEIRQALEPFLPEWEKYLNRIEVHRQKQKK